MEAQPAAGSLLVAVPGMPDPTFEGTVVYLFESEDGTAGIILNRPTDIALHEALPPTDAAAAEPKVVFSGGPVRADEGIALAVVGGEIITIALDAVPDAAPGTVRVFSGYAGWLPGQLARELDEGVWYVLDPVPDDVTTPRPLGLWRSVFARQDGPLRRYRTFPDDPRLN